MKRGTTNKAQISVFVIVGVLILLSIITLVYFVNVGSESTISNVFSGLNIGPELANIQAYSSDCTALVTYDALTVIGRQGGYYNKPERHFDFGWTFVPYYYDEGKFLMPSKESIEGELSSYVNNNIIACLDSVENTNLEITYSDPRTITIIEKEKVTFTIDVDVSLTKDGKTAVIELKDRPVVQDSALHDILAVAKYYTDSHRDNSEMICLDCVEDLAERSNLYVDMVGFDDLSTLIIISDDKSSFEPFIFEFFNKYTGEERFVHQFEKIAEIPSPPEGSA